MMKWFKDTTEWFKAHWLEWVLVVAYMSVLYWMASLNWQVIYFPVFFIVFTIISVAIIISFSYIKTPLQ